MLGAVTGAGSVIFPSSCFGQRFAFRSELCPREFRSEFLMFSLVLGVVTGAESVTNLSPSRFGQCFAFRYKLCPRQFRFGFLLFSLVVGAVTGAGSVIFPPSALGSVLLLDINSAQGNLGLDFCCFFLC